MPNLPVEQVDVIILGAGPAGISCALELKECNIRCRVIDRQGRPGGQLAEIPTEIRNLATGRFENGEALQRKLADLVSTLAIDMVLNEWIVGCDLGKRTLHSQLLVYEAKAIFLATGYRLRLLPKSDRFNAFGQDIFYHTGAVQDEFIDKAVVIVGSGDSAVLEALERAGTAKSVTVINRSATSRARPDLLLELAKNSRIRKLDNFVVEKLAGDGKLSEILLRSTADDTTMKIEADKMIVKIGYCPNTEIFRDQIDMEANGHIRVDTGCRTSVEGVFAGGDIASPGYDRIATAIGHGMTAARSIRKYMETQP